MSPETEPGPERTTYKLDKLVRDGIYLSMLDMGQIVETMHPAGRVFSDEELFDAKLAEELMELKHADYYKKRVKESADLMAVWDSYLRLCGEEGPALGLVSYVDKMSAILIETGINPYFVREMQAELRLEDGEFDNKRYVYSVSLLPGDEYNGYYQRDPERFPILN